MLEAKLSNEKLPNTFINLFDNVGELYQYV